MAPGRKDFQCHSFRQQVEWVCCWSYSLACPEFCGGGEGHGPWLPGVFPEPCPPPPPPGWQAQSQQLTLPSVPTLKLWLTGLMDTLHLEISVSSLRTNIKTLRKLALPWYFKLQDKLNLDRSPGWVVIGKGVFFLLVPVFPFIYLITFLFMFLFIFSLSFFFLPT